MIIGIISYTAAAGIFLALLLVLIIGRTNGSFRRLLALASAASALWAGAAAMQAAFDTPLIIPQLLELTRDLAWLAFLLHMLSAKADGSGMRSTGFRIVRHGVYVSTAVMAALVLYLHLTGSGLSVFIGFDFQFAGHLSLTVIGLVLLEQILRNTPLDLLRAIKYLCLGVGGIFVFDFYLYSDALLFQRIDPAL